MAEGPPILLKGVDELDELDELDEQFLQPRPKRTGSLDLVTQPLFGYSSRELSGDGCTWPVLEPL